MTSGDDRSAHDDGDTSISQPIEERPEALDRLAEDDEYTRPMTVVEQICWLLRPAAPGDRDPIDVLNDGQGAAQASVMPYEEWTEGTADEALAEELQDAIAESGVNDAVAAATLERLGREYIHIRRRTTPSRTQGSNMTDQPSKGGTQ